MWFFGWMWLIGELRVLSLQLLQNCPMLINTILVERTVERQKLWPRLKVRISVV